MMTKGSGAGRGRLREFRSAVWSPSSLSCEDVCASLPRKNEAEGVEDFEWKGERESKGRAEGLLAHGQGPPGIGPQEARRHT